MRLDVEVDAAGVELLENIRRNTGINSYQQIFSKSLALFNWATTKDRDGLVVATVDEARRTYTELDVKALLRAAARALAA